MGTNIFFGNPIVSYPSTSINGGSADGFLFNESSYDLSILTNSVTRMVGKYGMLYNPTTNKCEYNDDWTLIFVKNDPEPYVCLAGTHVLSKAELSVIPNLDDVTDIRYGRHLYGIEHGALSGCTSLSSVKGPSKRNSLAFIGCQAFAGCSSLVNVDVDNTRLIWVAENAFEGCSSANLSCLELTANADVDLAYETWGITPEKEAEIIDRLAEIANPGDKIVTAPAPNKPQLFGISLLTLLVIALVVDIVAIVVLPRIRPKPKPFDPEEPTPNDFPFPEPPPDFYDKPDTREEFLCTGRNPETPDSVVRQHKRAGDAWLTHTFKPLQWTKVDETPHKDAPYPHNDIIYDVIYECINPGCGAKGLADTNQNPKPATRSERITKCPRPND